jgi:hypothetical protein
MKTPLPGPKLARPTKEQIMAFTQEAIDALPRWSEIKKVIPGSFAKIIF